MKVTEALGKDHPTLSFEFFPPKSAEQEARLYQVISQLKVFQPDFVSITYGALGTTREKSFFWAKELKEKFGLEPVVHLTCVAATRRELALQLEELDKLGVKNILALRGDPPLGETTFSPPKNGFRFAKDLIAFVKQFKPDFCVGAAGFPEKHPQAPSQEKNITYLKEKIEAGADYVITQLFFDNKFFFDFANQCQVNGIKVPILPGIMPITSLKQIKKMTEICGSSIPTPLLNKLENIGNNPSAILKIGADQAIAQVKQLIAAKVPGLHFFVMNQAEPISQILKQLPL